ncbi:glycosyltransferase [Prevotella sp. LCP21S3_D2]|uniref:glycosyltransferase n=1 Tax=Prevotella sp. LCP21S3_D2 TaxID=3438800 RepID=UPI003F95C7FB
MKILCVLVLYHCKLQESRTYKTLGTNNEHLLVFDNSENPQNITSIAPEAIYIHNESNIGLSACYNRAAKYAKDHDYEWLLFLDQDTDFTEVAISDYLKAIERNPSCKMFAPMVKCGDYTMSPTSIKFHFATLTKNSYQGILDLASMSIINSGMCVSVNAFEECGGYNEKVFLDYSDHEFLRRFKKKNSEAYILPFSLRQDFSAQSDDWMKSLKRFDLFCMSLKGCEKQTFGDRCSFLFVVSKRACSLSLRNLSLKPFVVLFKSYIR